MSEFETVVYEKRDGIAYVTLNRPQALNVYNVRMRDELYQLLGAIREDREVRVAVLRGAGEKAFCAGADLSEFLTAPSPVIARQVRWERDIWGRFLAMPQPLLAALHGYVIGSGIEISLCCDIRIAAADARFRVPEAALGIIPAAGATQTFARATGRAWALDALLTGRWVDALEAGRMGLVNQVAPRPELAATVQQMAERIASRPAAWVQAVKEAVRSGADLALAEGLERERRLMALLRADS